MRGYNSTLRLAGLRMVACCVIGLILMGCGSSCDGFCTLDGDNIDAKLIYTSSDYDIYAEDGLTYTSGAIYSLHDAVAKRNLLSDRFGGDVDKIRIVLTRSGDYQGWYLFEQRDTVYLRDFYDVIFVHEYTHLLQMSRPYWHTEKEREGEACFAEKYIFGWSRFDGYGDIDIAFDGSFMAYVSAYQAYTETQDD